VRSKPIRIVNGQVVANLSYRITLHSLSEDYYCDYVHMTDITWKNKKYGYKRKKKGEIKTKSASRIIELRMQFRPVCGHEDEFDYTVNDVVGLSGSSSQDYVYKWHFAHRHGFPSDIKGSGRGQNLKVIDIFNHPLSYMLMCNEHHEQYDRENGEWKNPKNKT